MASPGQSSLFTVLNEMVSTTLRNSSKDVMDNVSNHNGLLRKMLKNGRKRTEDGGLSITCPIDYAQNGTVMRYSGFDTLNIQQSDVLTSAEYPWRQIAGNVVVSGLELRSNSGKNRLINLVTARVENLKRSLANMLANDIYSDGTASNQINGIQALVADAGTGTVGGINSSTWTFWQNQVRDASDNSVTVSAATIEAGMMLPLWLDCTRGGDTPDLIVMDKNYYTFFEQSQSSLKRYAPEDSGNAGMVVLKYHNADVVFDSTASGIPANHMYFLNTNFLEFVVHKDADFTVLDNKTSVNQDASVTPIILQANLVCSNRARQGVGKP